MRTPLPRSRETRGLLVLPVLLSISVLALYASVRPAYAEVAVGGSAGDFLQFEIGGRPAGMGGAHVGSAAGIMAQYWNPAALAALDQRQIGAMHATWLGDLNYEWIGYAQPLGSRLGVGSASVAYFHMPSIAGTDEFGQPTGEFRVYDMAVTLGLARSLGRGLSVGANAKMIRQNLATVSATGAAVDLGASATLAGTTFGAVVQNLGPELSFGGASYPLPRQIRLGLSRPFVGSRILVAADYNMPSDYYHDVRIGTEVRAHPNVSLRVGYRHEFGTPEDPADGLAYGLGIHFKQLALDYAMSPSDEFDDIHRLSFGYSFGSGGAPKEPEKEKPEETKPAPPAPTGPPVIAQAKPAPAPKRAPPSASAAPAPKQASPPPAPRSEPVEVAEVAPPAAAPAPKQAEPAPKPAPQQYAVVLPGYPSRESAQAEMKALELLGFKTKDAQIARDPKRGGYMISFARMKSKGSAEEVASSLQRMSFRAMVEVAQK